MKNRPFQQAVKRTIDLTAAAVLLLLCAPLLAAVALLIYWETGRPILFRQQRLGCRGRVFWLYKFRTMTDRPRKTNYEIMLGDPEVTPLGRILRRFKIDEMPQFWNVLRGDMSLIGPRPALPEQLDELDATALRRIDVRPGMTGLAQIHGNIHIPWKERWKYDVDYVDNYSLSLDVWILWRTMFTVVAGEERFARPWKAVER